MILKKNEDYELKKIRRVSLTTIFSRWIFISAVSFHFSIRTIKKNCFCRRRWLVDSQGSVFERVLLVLSGRDIPLITRELIYTGITRARQDVDIWAGEDLLNRAILRRIFRQSGLTDALQNPLKEILSNSN
jgi:hypothetical protein